MTNDVSVRRAKQRAKKAAAAGGSHQKALDGIAREQGHAHWAAMRSAQNVSVITTCDDVVATLFTRRGLLSRIEDPSDLSRIAYFLASVLSSSEHETTRAVTHVVVAMWLDAVGSADPGRLGEASLLDAAALMMRGTIESLATRPNGGHPGMPGDADLGDFVRTSMLDWMASPRSMADHVAVRETAAVALRIARPEAVWSAMDGLRKASTEVAEHPAGRLGRGDSRLLPDDVVLALVSLRMGGETFSSRHRNALRRLLTGLSDGEDFERISWAAKENAKQALGRVVETAYWALRIEGMTAGRARVILEDLETVEDGRQSLSERHASAIATMQDPLFTSWLSDALAKIDAGEAPFTFNPVANALRSREGETFPAVCRDVAALCGDPDIRSEVAYMISNLVDLLVVTSRRREEIGLEAGVDVGLPMIHAILAAWCGRWEQLLLFGALNDVPDDRIVPLREAFSKGLAEPALRALEVFSNAALAMAAA